MAAPDDVIARIVAAAAADAAAMVLAMHPQQARPVLTALGPREAARLLRAARADRVPVFLETLGPRLLPAVLTQLALPEIAQLLPLLTMDGALRIVASLPADTAAQLLLALPTAQRMALQSAVAPPSAATPAGVYGPQVEQAVRRSGGRVSWVDPQGRSLVADIFGRPVQIVSWDRPGATFGAGDLHAAIGATDWRHISGLVVVTNATLDPALPPAVREARAAGYTVEPVQWQDERDDGTLKRVLVRLVS